MSDVIIARALHVLAVVAWIGGVTMVTAVVLPAIRRGELGADRLQAFHVIERRFVWLARTALIVVAATGVYMIERLALWHWFRTTTFWWMHAMVGVWALFAITLFIVDPLFLQRGFQRWASAAPDTALAWLHRAHWFLLALSAITILGAVAGSQGLSF